MSYTHAEFGTSWFTDGLKKKKNKNKTTVILVEMIAVIPVNEGGRRLFHGNA